MILVLVDNNNPGEHKRLLSEKKGKKGIIPNIWLVV